MEALVFVALVCGVAVVGLLMGLRIAPRLTAWDDRRAREDAADADVVDDDAALDDDAARDLDAAHNDGSDGGDAHG